MKAAAIQKALSIIPKDYVSHYNATSWGGVISIMEKTGIASCRISWDNADKTTIYLNGLSVNEEKRNQEIGTQLQELREEMGRIFGAKRAMLTVKKSTWISHWYKKRGYKIYAQIDDSIYMSKRLN